jgi:hypothetical protein
MSNHETASIEDIDDLANRFHDLATDLSNRVVHFEERLRHLKGKVPVRVAAPGIELKFERESNVWRLTVYTNVTRAWKPLVNASVEEKIKAIELFDHLINSMAKTHRGKVALLEASLSKLDALNLDNLEQAKEGE